MASLESEGKRFLLFLAGIMVLALLFLAGDMYHWKFMQDREMRSFQKMVGGVGMGAMVVPSWNEIDFDARLQSVDDSKIWPIPGSYCYSPAQSTTVTHFKEFLRDSSVIVGPTDP